MAGEKQCADLEEEILSFSKAINDDAGDSAAYQVEIAQPVGPVDEKGQVGQTRAA
jgi:hypothetical protein